MEIKEEISVNAAAIKKVGEALDNLFADGFSDEDGEMDPIRVRIADEIQCEGDKGQAFTVRKDRFGVCAQRFEAGTNGYHGGDTGHGGRTYLRITDLASTDMRVRVNHGKEGGDDEFRDCMGGSVEILLGGDDELDAIIEGLTFIVSVLKAQATATAGARESRCRKRWATDRWRI